MEYKSLHVDSIWKSNKTGDIVKVIIEPRSGDQRVHYINLNNNDHWKMLHVDKAVFVAEHTFLRDNDNGALYRHDRNPNLYFKVIETTEKACIGTRLRFVKYRSIKGDSVEENDGCLIVSFHSYCHLLSLDPESLPESNVSNKYDKLQTHAIIPGSIYFSCVGGIHIVIPFKEESGVISFVMSDCLNDEVYFTTDIAEFVERYTLYQVFNKPDNGEAFDELVNKTMVLYDKIINKMNKENNGGKVVKDRITMGSTWINKKSKEKCVATRIVGDMVEYCSQSDEIRTMCKECFVDEFEMITHDKSKRYTTSDKDTVSMKMRGVSETYLKTDASKLEDFGTGAKREDKTGKGRYDLIPGDVMNQLEDFAWAAYFMNGATTCSATDVSKSAYFDDWTNVELYYDFIVNVISYFFASDRVECTDDCGEISYVVNWNVFRSGLYEMRKQLALHYEAGAGVHGVDNWKKGLPVYGSARGGCFLDSMRRHIDQALQGKDDEPHAIAAIWNAFGAVWTLKHRPYSAMYQYASDVKVEEYEKN